MTAPGYWMHETSGVLKPAVEAYLINYRAPLSPEHCAALRAYFRQWINAPAFIGPGIERLRAAVDGLTSREAINQWLRDALDEGIDPL